MRCRCSGSKPHSRQRELEHQQCFLLRLVCTNSSEPGAGISPEGFFLGVWCLGCVNMQGPVRNCPGPGKCWLFPTLPLCVLPFLMPGKAKTSHTADWISQGVWQNKEQCGVVVGVSLFCLNRSDAWMQCWVTNWWHSITLQHWMGSTSSSLIKHHLDQHIHISSLKRQKFQFKSSA